MRDATDDRILRRIAREGKWQPFWGAFFAIAKIPLIGPYLLLYMLLGIPVVAVVVVAQAQVPRDQLGTAQAVVTSVAGTDRVARKLEYTVEIEGVPYTGEVQWATKENGDGPWTIGDRFTMHYDKRHPWIRWRKDPIPFWLFLPLTVGITVVLWGAGYAWWMTQHDAPARATPQEVAWLSAAARLLASKGEFSPRALDEACGRAPDPRPWERIVLPLDALIESAPHAQGRDKRRMDTYAEWRAAQRDIAPLREGFVCYEASVRLICGKRICAPAIEVGAPAEIRVKNQEGASQMLHWLTCDADQAEFALRRLEFDLRGVRPAEVRAIVEKLRRIQIKCIGRVDVWDPGSVDWERKDKHLKKMRRMARKQGLPESLPETCPMRTINGDGTHHDLRVTALSAMCSIQGIFYALYECPWRDAALSGVKDVSAADGRAVRLRIEFRPGDRFVIERVE